ncbi:MAG: DUF1345 domain-containing protein [Kovacikia sp.]
MPKLKPEKFLNVRSRLLLAVISAALMAALIPNWVHLPTRSLSVWDTGMFCFLALTWWTMLRATPETMRRKAQQQDVGRLVILSLITALSCVSVLAIAFMLRESKHATLLLLAVHLSLSFITILGAWLLVHTIFALHYAYGYYHDDSKTLEQCKAEELDFPGEEEPNYWDFLYFSFVIGMTSQVSDVQVISRSLRRLTLFHSILAFFFNTMILAMSINVFAGLIQGAG